MNSPDNLSLGEKIRQIRKAKGLSQENMAYAIKKSRIFVTRLENGQADFTPDLLAAIKKFLEIEDAPLLAHELEVYKDRLRVWYEMLAAYRFTEARDMQPLLASIVDLPYERDLIMLFILIEASLVYMEWDIPAADAMVDKVGAMLVPDEASPETRALFHRHIGVRLINRGNIDTVSKDDVVKALGHFLAANNMNSSFVKPNEGLLRNIANCYYNLGNVYKTIQYYEQILKDYTPDQTQIIGAVIRRALGVCYCLVGELSKAKVFCELAVSQFQVFGIDFHVLYSLVYSGIVSLEMGDHREALSFFYKADDYVSDETSLKGAIATTFPDSHNNMRALLIFCKALCLLEMKAFAKAKEVIKEGRAWAKKHNREYYTVLTEAPAHLITLHDINSSDYIHNVAIPTFLAKGTNVYSMALRLCKILEAHYMKRGATRKALEVAGIQRDIYKTMLYGGSELELDSRRSLHEQKTSNF